MATKNIAPTSFTVFPELPSELRIKIWKFAMSDPQILGVGHRMQHRKSRIRKVPIPVLEWRTSDPVPAILHVCHESRDEALKVYRPSFGIPLEPGKNYIDFSRDTIYFGGSSKGFVSFDHLMEEVSNHHPNYLLDMFLGADSGARDGDKIERMIIEIDDDRYGRRSFIWDEIRLFTSLLELTMIVWEGLYDAERLMALYRTTLCDVARKHPEWIIPNITVISEYTREILGTMNASTPMVEEWVSEV